MITQDEIDDFLCRCAVAQYRSLNSRWLPSADKRTLMEMSDSWHRLHRANGNLGRVAAISAQALESCSRLADIGQVRTLIEVKMMLSPWKNMAIFIQETTPVARLLLIEEMDSQRYMRSLRLIITAFSARRA